MDQIDQLWVIVATALVLLMQCGFLLLETGMTRAKNYINVAVKNLVDFGMAILMFWLLGSALMFGDSALGGLVGFSGFAPDLTTIASESTVFFMFQAVFAGTTVTIISGAIAERTSFSGYFGIVVAMAFVYPIFGHWVWGGGWLAERGFVDFAGSTVVHSMGGWAALAAMLVIGARRGRFNSDGSSAPIRASNLPLAMTGGLILWFGWIGFNGGSTLAFNETVPGIVAVTILGGAAGLMAALALGIVREGYPVPSDPLNGSLAGLVAVTAGTHVLPSWAAVLVGAIGGMIAVLGEDLLEKLRVDDAVGAVPVHLMAGMWGTLAVGLFGRLDVLGTGHTRLGQIGAQLLGIGAAAAWGFGVCFVTFKAINTLVPLRVSAEHEDEGLNVAEHREPTALLDLLHRMEYQARTGAISEPIEAESFTEVGQIANQFNGLTDQLRSMSSIAEKIANGELDVDVVPRSDQDTFGIAFRRMVRDLRSTVRGIATTATELTYSASTLAQLTDAVESGVGVQRDGVERGEFAFGRVRGLIDDLASSVDDLAQRTGNALDQLVVLVTEATDATARADQAAERSASRARDGGSDLRSAVVAIDRSASEISGIVETVRSIVDTTKLLSLNANIEAARAGEHAKAFAVVAEEVHELAGEAMTSLGEIEEAVAGLQATAAGAVTLVDGVVGDVVSLADSTRAEIGVAAHVSSNEIATARELQSSFDGLSTKVAAVARDLQNEAADARMAIESIAQVGRENEAVVADFRQLSDQVQQGAKNVDERISRFDRGSVR